MRVAGEAVVEPARCGLARGRALNCCWPILKSLHNEADRHAFMVPCHGCRRAWERYVVIHRSLERAAFDARAVKAMTRGYEAALHELRLADRPDPSTEIIARKIVECARTGERNPERLCEPAVRDMRV